MRKQRLFSIWPKGRYEHRTTALCSAAVTIYIANDPHIFRTFNRLVIVKNLIKSNYMITI